MSAPVIVVITGPRDRQATLVELERAAEILRERAVAAGVLPVLRHGACPWRKSTGGHIPSIDLSVSSWVKARGLAVVEPWPAEEHGPWPACGPRRNLAMLAGRGQAEMFGPPASPPASLVLRFGDGGPGTTHCSDAAAAQGIEVERIEPGIEPKPWNVHWGDPSGPMTYVGRGHPLGNPTPLDVGDGETRATAAPAALEDYRRHLGALVKANDRDVLDALDSITPDHHLACSCWPAHCHVEIIIRAWRWRSATRDR